MIESQGPSSLRVVNRQAVVGVMWSGGAQVITQVVTLVARVVQARLLMPADFGLLGMATVVLAFVELLAGLGLGAAVVQAPDLDETDRSTAFWASIVQGLGLAVLGVAVAPLIAWFFKEPRLTGVLQVLLAGTALLGPLAVVQALFLRSLDFKTVATRQVVGDIVGAAVGIGLALAGAGVWSLVVGRLADSAVGLSLVWLRAKWYPKWALSRASLKKLGGYSAAVTAGGVFHAATRQLPAVIIGRVLGSDALGQFALAQQIALLPLQYVARPISRVLFPTFARLQDRPNDLARSYLKWQTVVVALGALVLATIAGLAPLAVPRLLGHKWDPAIPLFIFLGAPAIARLSVAVAGSALRALGRLRLIGIWTTSSFVLQGVGLVAGLHWGLVGAVAGWSAGSVVSLVIGLVLTGKAVKLTPLRQLRPLRVVALPVAALGAVSWTVVRVAESFVEGVPLLVLGAAATLGVGAYVVVLFLTAREDWNWIMASARGLVASRGRTAPQT